MKKILLLLSAAALWNCTDYAADWDEKYENKFSNTENDTPAQTPEGTPTQTPSYSVCEEGKTTTLVNGNCTTDLVCQNDSWSPTSYICNDKTQDLVCEEGLTTSLEAGGCITNFICSGNAWVPVGNPVCATIPIESSSSESPLIVPESSSDVQDVNPTNSPYPMVSPTTVSNINCTNAMYCPNNCGIDCGIVYTGVDDGKGNQGYLWTYTDADANGGTSSFYWPEGLDEYDSFEPPSRQKFGYVNGFIIFGSGYEFPYGRIGFHIKGSGSSTDITVWGGMCIVYTATQEFYLRIQADKDDTFCGFDDYQARIPAATSMSLVNVSWSDFVQEGWGKIVSQAQVLSSAQTILFNFKGDAGTSNEFTIHAIGKYGTCNK